MTIELRQVDDLYAKFGFKTLNSKKDNIRIYAYRDSYFHNAEIVHVDPVNKDILDKILIEYQKSGYACRIKHIHSMQEAEDLLFNGFFAVESSRQRLLLDYERFTTRLTRSLGAPYEYIKCNYTADNLEDTKPLLDVLLNELNTSNPTLIIIEAAAGYGKTCTAYETLKWVIDKFKDRLPVLTELSRNRQARHFRYVLLDQIDRDFPQLNYDLVKHYIHQGKIPVIVDGFDELLHRNKVIDDKFEDAEPMLETIGSLLEKNSKVILTTRRTAIFSGDDFCKWLDSQGSRFNVLKIKLEKPTLEDWLGYEKLKHLEEAGIPLRLISSPVLLSYLRNLSETVLLSCCKSPQEIVDRYFTSLLEREQERQDLLMSVVQQLSVFQSLAKDMVDEDFTAESRDFLHLRIIDKHSSLLSSIRESYPREARPTVEELGTKLVNHALLDRKNDSEDAIGFVNEFALGTLVGKNICSNTSSDWIGDQRFADAAITAFIPRIQREKEILWQNLQSAIELYDETFQLLSSHFLCGKFHKSFNNCTISDIEIDSTSLGANETYTDVVFVNCKFSSVILYRKGLFRTSFVNCLFYNCNIQQPDPPIPDDCQAYFINCKSTPDITVLFQTSILQTTAVVDERYYDRMVLRRFWPQGRAYLAGRKALRTLYLGEGHLHSHEIANSIDNLRKQGILSIRSTFAEINMDKLDVIRRILGRE